MNIFCYTHVSSIYFLKLIGCNIVLCNDQLYRVVFFDGVILTGKNDAKLWVFIPIKNIVNAYTVVDFLNHRFLSVNYLTKNAYSLPITSCCNMTYYSVVKQKDNSWIISTVIDNVTYALSSYANFISISSPINTYVPDLALKSAITSYGSMRLYVKKHTLFVLYVFSVSFNTSTLTCYGMTII